MTKTANIRISINDLVKACQLLPDLTVVSAGFMYATLELTEKQRKVLNDWGVYNQTDK